MSGLMPPRQAAGAVNGPRLKEQNESAGHHYIVLAIRAGKRVELRTSAVEVAYFAANSEVANQFNVNATTVFDHALVGTTCAGIGRSVLQRSSLVKTR